MTELTHDLSLAQAKSLIDSYAFDLGGKDPQELIDCWRKTYSASWIGMATIEALYLGRYKAISIEHILSVWLRMGSPNIHFTYEFERLICRKLPKHLSDLAEIGNQNHPKIRTKNPSSLPPNDPPEEPAIVTTVFGKELKELNDSHQTKPATSVELKAPTINRNLSLISALGLNNETNWSEFNREHNTIHQFIPLPDVSSFFNKLKTFSEEKLEG